MVAKRDLSPRFSPQVQKQTPRSQSQYGRNDVVSMHSRSSHSTSGASLAPANIAGNYSEAVSPNYFHINLRKKIALMRLQQR